MKEEKFKVIQFIRELVLAIDKQMDNFPKKDIELKQRIRSNTYDLLEISYEANSVIEKNDKQALLFKMISKIKVIDFLLNISLDRKIITEKKYYKLSQKIDDIAKYTNGWLKSII